MMPRRNVSSSGRPPSTGGFQRRSTAVTAIPAPTRPRQRISKKFLLMKLLTTTELLCAMGLITLASTAHATVAANGLFIDHTVLQRGKPCPDWGVVTPNKTIAATIAQTPPVHTITAAVDGKGGAMSSATEHQARKPNILFLLADDWAWPHASCLRTPGILTPTFDRLAREGVLFRNAHVAAHRARRRVLPFSPANGTGDSKRQST